MVEEGLVVMSDVEIIKYAHRPVEAEAGDDADTRNKERA